MLPDLDTYAAALAIDRELILRRVDRQAPLLEAAKLCGPAPTVTRAPKATMRVGWLARVITCYRWLLRPSHA